MKSTFTQLFLTGWAAPLLLAVVAAGALVLGAALPTLPLLRLQLFQRRLSVLIGFSAGIMLATALHELIPEAMAHNAAHAMTGVGIGFLVLYTAERITHFHACRHRECELDTELNEEESACEHHANAPAHFGGHEHIHHFDTMALVGMSIHNIADGLTLAAAFSVTPVIGLMVVLAIVLHQSAVGVSLGAIMLRARRNHRRILLAAAGVASFIVLGVIFYHLVVPVGEASRGVVLGLAAGSFLYVASCDLLPHAHAEDEGWIVTASTLLGYAFVLVVGMLAG
jgi:zinc and cadmium transporter